jgi:hypothetical protein
MEGTRFRVEFLDQNVIDQLKALPKSAQKMIYLNLCMSINRPHY